MITKAFEIRDSVTFIPVIAIKMVPYPDSKTETWDGEAERYLLRRSGYEFSNPCVVIVKMEASGISDNATYDPFYWKSRTMSVAHQHIIDNFEQLTNGSVIDVEFILGETAQPKTSERFNP